MRYKGTMNDLRSVGQRTSLRIKGTNVRHAVYAYITKNEPNEIVVLDWDTLYFETDEDFDKWLKTNEKDLEMVYAIHKL